MALQDGFKVLGLTIIDGGDHWGTENDGELKEEEIKKLNELWKSDYF